MHEDSIKDLLTCPRRRLRRIIKDFIILTNVKNGHFFKQSCRRCACANANSSSEDEKSDGFYIQLTQKGRRRDLCGVEAIKLDQLTLQPFSLRPPAGKGSSSISSDISSSTDHTPTKAPKNASATEGKASGAH